MLVNGLKKIKIDNPPHFSSYGMFFNFVAAKIPLKLS